MDEKREVWLSIFIFIQGKSDKTSRSDAGRRYLIFIILLNRYDAGRRYLCIYSPLVNVIYL